MATNSTGAVFFLGTRAHYQVLEQPSNYDAENGNASTETIYQNQSVEELWPSEGTHNYDRNYNPERVNWGYCEQSENGFNRSKSECCVKRRVKRRSSEALLCDDVRPAALNIVEDKTELKPKPRRISLLSFLTSLARRKRPTEQVQYLQHIESVLNNCTYRESCRCLDCQSRYFECDEESDGYSSDDDYSRYSIKEVESQVPDELDDEVFVSTPENDNTSTDLLLDEGIQEEPVEEVIDTDREDDQQLQVEVAASTTAMFNLLLVQHSSVHVPASPRSELINKEGRFRTSPANPKKFT